jgi:hypothetical protein
MASRSSCRAGPTAGRRASSSSAASPSPRSPTTRRPNRTPSSSRASSRRCRDQLGQAIDELRDIAHGIHPALLTARGLGAAVEALTARTPLPVTVELEPSAARWPEAVEVAGHDVAAEALTNVVKYVEATRATIRVGRDGDHALVEVADGGADPRGGSGVRGLADRVETLDGRLEVLSPPGAGTRVRAAIPLHGAPRERSAPPRTRRAGCRGRRSACAHDGAFGAAWRGAGRAQAQRRCVGRLAPGTARRLAATRSRCRRCQSAAAEVGAEGAAEVMGAFCARTARGAMRPPGVCEMRHRTREVG